MTGGRTRRTLSTHRRQGNPRLQESLVFTYRMEVLDARSSNGSELSFTPPVGATGLLGDLGLLLRPHKHPVLMREAVGESGRLEDAHFM